MRLPPSVRYLPSRFQGILNPWLWLGILVTGVVGLYAWEYRQNPGQLPWQLGNTGFGSSGNATSTDVLLESLTPEEQAVAAELDNVELLLAQLDSDLSALTTGGESSAAASLNALSAGVEAGDAESTVERLNRYVDEYRFLGTDATGSNFQTARPGQSTVGRQTTPSASASQTTNQTTNAVPSALAEAFAQQQAAASANPAASNSSGIATTSSNGESTGAAATADTAAGSNQNSSTFSFDQSAVDQTGVTPGSLDGLNRAFIRTTPNMSPPPGTTGYVPPATLPDFNRLNQAAGIEPLPTQPSAGSFGTVPTVTVPDRSQVLPPAQSQVVTPLEIPTFDGASQTTPNQPRNAWEAIWD
ncbi:MAG: hypothetical protein AAF572_20865 [Cyanobacteria bacterium P01_B01_bin.77]